MKIRFKPSELSEYLRMGIHTYRGKLLVQASFWSAAVLVGLAALYFSKLINFIQNEYIAIFSQHPFLMSIFTPVAFVAAAAMVNLFAPAAGGSGVPQVLYAAQIAKDSQAEIIEKKLVSLWTAIIKVISTCLGFIGGASIGGEGPTVQLSASIFAHIGKRIKKVFPHLDFQSYVVAGAGTGIAAAFNAPLGGVAFALEEVAVGDFGDLKQMVILAVIIAGLTAAGLIGNELYFGSPVLGVYNPSFVGWAVLIGASGGLMGGLFGRIVTSRRFFHWQVPWWTRALACGAAVSIINLAFSGDTGGSGYSITRAMFEGNVSHHSILFPLAKLFGTALSTLSGMGGGILAPSLSIGSWMGVSVAKMASYPNLQVCALLGMVAYFSGAFQIPLTAIIVVMEVTNQHDIIIPMMVAALSAFVVARLIMPVSLYHSLIKRTYGNHHHTGHPEGPGGPEGTVTHDTEVTQTSTITVTDQFPISRD